LDLCADAMNYAKIALGRNTFFPAQTASRIHLAAGSAAHWGEFKRSPDPLPEATTGRMEIKERRREEGRGKKGNGGRKEQNGRRAVHL